MTRLKMGLLMIRLNIRLLMISLTFIGFFLIAGLKLILPDDRLDFIEDFLQRHYAKTL